VRATTRCELYAERKDAILGRAKEIAQELLASPAFQEDLATARQEMKSTSK
jgi:hypothetical protein